MSKDYLGRGWKFPVAVDPVTGKIAMSQYEEDIRESILIILGTSIGERVMNVDFGCGINEFVFETTDTGTITLIEHNIKEALYKWEKRITDVTVKCGKEPESTGVLYISVDYMVRETNTAGNLVYPFYIE